VFDSLRPSERGGNMSCLSCLSDNQAEFTAEMIIHSSGPKNLDKPGVWVFPKLLVCLDCGVSRFTIPETKRGLLTTETPTAESSVHRERVHDIARSRQIPF
jgi:hypothetical protein